MIVCVSVRTSVSVANNVAARIGALKVDDGAAIDVAEIVLNGCTFFGTFPPHPLNIVAEIIME